MAALGDNFSTYAPDHVPLTAKQIAALRKDAAIHLPQGETLFREDLYK